MRLTLAVRSAHPYWGKSRYMSTLLHPKSKETFNHLFKYKRFAQIRAVCVQEILGEDKLKACKCEDDFVMLQFTIALFKHLLSCPCSKEAPEERPPGSWSGGADQDRSGSTGVCTSEPQQPVLRGGQQWQLARRKP